MPKQATSARADAAAEGSAAGGVNAPSVATKQGRTSVTRKATRTGRHATGRAASTSGRNATTRVASTTARTTNAPPAPLSKSGVPLTDELVDKLATEAERGYDLSRARRVGRPSLGSSGVSPRVNVRMSQELHALASQRAVREGKTLSQVARDALERYVA